MSTGHAGRDNAQAVTLLGLLDKHGGKWGQRAVAAMAAMQLAKPTVDKARHHRWREAYTITVGGTDNLYPDLHEWVLQRIPAADRKAMLLDTSTEYGGSPDMAVDSSQRKAVVKLRYDGSREQKLRLEGHEIRVTVAREELPGGSANVSENWRRYLERITFSSPTTAGRDAVVRMIEGLAQKRYGEDEDPPLMLPSRWGGEWTRRDDLKPRSLESVILKEGQLEQLVGDLEKFIAAESEYVRLFQPWHRGYLFHGDPGTGKTSVARALASHFKLPVYYLPLGDLEKDANLMGLIQQVKPRSMLLIEDVDVYHATTERSDVSGRVSLSAMLNALDGIWTPHGLVTVLTTNSVKTLDPALVRAGRIDVSTELTNLDEQQLLNLFAYAGRVGDNLEDWKQWLGRSPAELMEALRGAPGLQRQLTITMDERKPEALAPRLGQPWVDPAMREAFLGPLGPLGRRKT